MSVLIGDCRQTLQTLEPDSVQTCVTSPPYWGLRDYGHDGQLGLEETPDAYVTNMVEVFREVRRVLRPDGTLWLNLGDSYANNGEKKTGRNDEGPEDIARRAAAFNTGARKASTGGNDTRTIRVDSGLKPKDLCGIPWRVAFALQADGWWLRSDIIWNKPNPMPESVTDRPTKAHEYVFLLSKSASYFYDAKAIAEPATAADHGRSNLGGGAAVRNARSVWPIASEPYDGAHFAVMPSALAARCILAGSRMGDTVLDPFLGSGTVGMVAEELGRKWVGCELNPEFGKLIAQRTAQQGLFGRVGT